MNKNLTFNEIFNEYIEDKKENWKMSTYRRTCQYYYQIKPYLGNKVINDITRDELNDWRNKLIHSSLSSKTLSHDYFLLRALYKYNLLYHRGKVNKAIEYLKPFTSDPNRIIDLDVKYKYWSKEDTIRFIKECNKLHAENLHNKYYHGGFLACKIIVALCVFAGLRLGEATALQVKDLIYSKGSNQYSIKITKTKGITHKIDDENYLTSPKSKSSIRIVPIPDIFRDILLEVKNRDDVDENCFFSSGKKYTSSDFIKRIKRKVEENLKIEHIRMHDLRHTYVHSLYANSVPTHLVSKYLGHANEDVVINEYLHFDEESKHEVTDKLNEYYKDY